MKMRDLIKVNTKIADTRQLIYSLFNVQTDFRSFLCDYLPYLHKEIPVTISYAEQVTFLLEREKCDTILQAIRSAVDFLRDENRLDEERYSILCDEIQKISDVSEPRMKNLEFGRPKRSKRISRFLRRLVRTFGVIWIYEQIRWLWSKVNSITVEGGTIVIAGFAGGGLYLSIHSCRYEAGQQSHLPDWSMVHSALVAQQSRHVNFCTRQITVLQEDEPILPTPKYALDSKQIQQSQQLIHHVNHLLSMYAPMEVPSASNTELAPYLGNSQLLSPSFGRYGGLYAPRDIRAMLEPAIIACVSSQADRLAIDISLKWKKKAEKAVRNCLPNEKCNDGKMITVSCEFSYSIANQNNQYDCPNKSFTILSNEISYMQPPIVLSQQDLPSNASPVDIDFSSVLSHCSSAFSAITLLAACRRH